MMHGPGIHLQIGQDRLVVTCARNDTTHDCVEAATPVLEMFLGEVHEADLDAVEVPAEGDD